MAKVTYRPYQATDADAVKAMVTEAFYLDRYAPTNITLRSVQEIYLRECLAASSYAQVAELNGTAVGILMGRVARRPYLPGRFAHQLRLLMQLAKISVAGFKQRKTLLQHFAIEGAYRQIKERTTVPLTNELTLFAVDASARGHGVGKQLYADYMEHLSQSDQSNFYLFTDLWCTYQFYEQRGMLRAETVEMTLEFGQGPEDFEVYLYSGTPTLAP